MEAAVVASISEEWMMMHSLAVEVAEVVQAEEVVVEWEAWAEWVAWEDSHPDSCQEVSQEPVEGKAETHSSTSKCE